MSKLSPKPSKPTKGAKMSKDEFVELEGKAVEFDLFTGDDTEKVIMAVPLKVIKNLRKDR